MVLREAPGKPAAGTHLKEGLSSRKHTLSHENKTATFTQGQHPPYPSGATLSQLILGHGDFQELILFSFLLESLDVRTDDKLNSQTIQ